MDARRRQEQEDEALARRLQFGLAVDDDVGPPNVFHFLRGNAGIHPALIGRHAAAAGVPGLAGNRDRPQLDRRAPAPTPVMQREIHDRDPYHWLPAAMERHRRLLLDEEAGHWRREGDPVGLYTYNPASPPQRAADMAGLGGDYRGEQRVADWLDHVNASE